MARTPALALVLAAFPALAAADVIELKNGGHIEGQIVSETADRVVVDVPAGQVTIPRNRIAHLRAGASALAEYRQRAARLRAGDAAGWLALADWARDAGLSTQARDAYEHVLQVEPASPAAHQALGHVFTAGRWMSEGESYRSRGYIPFEGGWVRPEERQAILQDRAAADADLRARAESVARVHEAEARAAAAEAEADRRRADAAAQESSGGIPFTYAYGGGAVLVPTPVMAPPPPVTVTVVEPARRRPERDRPARHQGGGSGATQGGATTAGAWKPFGPRGADQH